LIDNSKASIDELGLVLKILVWSNLPSSEARLLRLKEVIEYRVFARDSSQQLYHHLAPVLT